MKGSGSGVAWRQNKHVSGNLRSAEGILRMLLSTRWKCNAATAAINLSRVNTHFVPSQLKQMHFRINFPSFIWKRADSPQKDLCYDAYSERLPFFTPTHPTILSLHYSSFSAPSLLSVTSSSFCSVVHRLCLFLAPLRWVWKQEESNRKDESRKGDSSSGEWQHMQQTVEQPDALCGFDGRL